MLSLSTNDKNGLPFRTVFLLLAVPVFVLSSGNESHAQFRRNGGLFGSVGGVSIDAAGILSSATAVDHQRLKQLQLKLIEEQKPSTDLAKLVPLRKISLRRLEAAIANALKNNEPLPDEIQLLAGLQRIQYVFVYPEQNDIVLAGPAEGWQVSPQGELVGVTTGRPVLHLDDLIVALRTSDNARRGAGISCSIDPTAEGRQALQGYLDTLRTFNSSVPANVERALGNQVISVTGVPGDSHFARVLVAADYKMKRIAMKLEAAPIKGLPSYVDMMKASASRNQNMMPRWWLACNYLPLARSEDGLAWELRGPGVKTMTEDDFITENGQVQGTGQKSPLAQKWADMMTDKYEELSVVEPIFGQLRNAMDMCVVAALIQKEDMLTQAGCQLPLLIGSDSALAHSTWNTPRTVPSQASVMKQGRNWIITASGGVQVESWQTAARTVASEEVGQLRGKIPNAASNGAPEHWWWN